MDCLVCEMFGVWDVFGVGCLMSGLFFFVLLCGLGFMVVCSVVCAVRYSKCYV